MFKMILIDSYRKSHLYHTCKSGGTFLTYGDWHWRYNQPKREVRTFDDSMYLGVL